MSTGIPPSQDSVSFHTDRTLIAMETHNPLFQMAGEDVNMGYRHTRVLSVVLFDPNTTLLL